MTGGVGQVDYQGIPKDDFMRFALTKLPGIDQALTVVAELTAASLSDSSIPENETSGPV